MKNINNPCYGCLEIKPLAKRITQRNKQIKHLKDYNANTKKELQDTRSKLYEAKEKIKYLEEHGDEVRKMYNALKQELEAR